MTDTLSKAIGIVLSFILLVFAPLTINEVSDDSQARRVILNEVENFIDMVTDKAYITSYDVNDLILGINSSGIPCDVEVYRYENYIYNDASGVHTAYVCSNDDYFSSNFLKNNTGTQPAFKQGDMVKVTVTAIASTGAQRLLKNIGVITEPYSFSLAGTVR